LTILGGVGLLLAILGVYGVTAYSVNQRTREFGIRMALGAQRYHIIGTVLQQGLILAGAGVVLGLVATIGLSHVVSAVLFGISATNLGTLIFASVTLVLAVLLASFVPSQKATKIDPLQALRYE
jgi:ABC-type antimicrobial peptide transport system permease subunit